MGKKKKKKRKAEGEPDDAPADGRTRVGEFELKFIEGPERGEAASQKQLNNKPAWMTRGVGVNKEMFGESKGNLVKPGMYEDDLARIEAMKGNPLGDGPDPFGDVFAERNSPSASPLASSPASPPASGDAPAGGNPWKRSGPLPPQDMQFSSR